jgi:aminopeptidase N
MTGYIFYDQRKCRVGSVGFGKRTLRMIHGRDARATFSSRINTVGVLLVLAMLVFAQTPDRSSAAGTIPTAEPQASPTPTHANLLRGEYGRYRAYNDLLSYNLNIRVDPEKKFVSGKNTIRFKMLKDDTRIQLDLYDNLKVDKIQYTVSGVGGRVSGISARELKYQRDSGAVFIDFPETLKAGRTYSIDFYYSGTPQTIGRFGGFTFGKDPAGRPWIFTACEGEGASIWWPNKDQWKDEVESMKISVAIPNNLIDVSNGKFIGKTDLGDGYTRWDYLVQYPINQL